MPTELELEEELEYEDPFPWEDQADYSVIGPTDDRFRIPARSNRPSSLLFPTNTICFLEMTARDGRRFTGSGTLIAPQVVLTAKHCLMDVHPPCDRVQRVFDPRRFFRNVRVTPGADLQPPNPRLQRPASPPSQVAGSARFRADPNLDFGVVILPAPFRTPSRYMMLQARSRIMTATLLTIAGYPCDKPRGTMWGHSGRIPLVNVTPTHLQYTIDTCPGHSGSPIWLLGGQDVRLLLGVHTTGPSGCNNDPIGGRCQRTGARVTPVAGLNCGVRITCHVIDTIVHWCREFGVREPAIDRVVYRRHCGTRPGTARPAAAAGARELGNGRQFEATPSSPGSVVKCPMICFDHFHIPKTADPKNPGHFNSGALTLLKPVNPGFIDANDALITDTSSTGLQTCLKNLITTKFPEFLSKASRASGAPSSNDRLHVALVDLTGDKLSNPEFAGWGSTAAMYGASAPKTLAVYTAFQLRADLRQMASSNSLSKGTSLENFALKAWKAKKLWRDFPNLNWLFHIRQWSGDPDTLDFTSDVRAVFEHIKENADASQLIRGVGFPYIASVAWQSGLRHPTRGGLWLTKAYDGKPGWLDPPALKAPAFIHNLTALSGATYFTLLAQDRLVGDSSSAEIRKVLQGGCISCLFPTVMGLQTAVGLQAAKCGIYKPYIHDCVLIERPEVRYAAAILSELNAKWDPKSDRCPTGKETERYTELWRTVDALMVRNNKSPKPSCG